MHSRIIEATQGLNWGRFLVARFEDSEWQQTAQLAPGKSILASGGNSKDCFLLVDLVTGEGAIFEPHGIAAADLNGGRHQIWVCLLFEPVLAWLYANKHLLADLAQLPAVIELPPDTPGGLWGYRRKRKAE